MENVVLSSFYQKREEEVRYWRTLGQAEVDFILKFPDKIIPVEVKYSSFKSPVITRSLKNFLSLYKPSRILVFTKGFWGKAKVKNTEIAFVPVWYAI